MGLPGRCHGLVQREAQGVEISMDGKGRFLDNIFIERLWRSLKYEEVFIRAYVSVAEARLGIGNWITFYNDERKHQALGYRTPSEIFAMTGTCAYVDNARALTTSTQVQQQPTEKDLNHERKVIASHCCPV